MRLKHGFSQEELSTRAGLNRTYLSDIERGYGNATLDVMNRLASALHVGLSQMFLGIAAGSNKTVKIFCAADEASERKLCQVLSGYEVQSCLQMKEARRLLEEGDFDLVICVPDFAQGRMFDLLRLVKMSERHKNIPFVTIDLKESVDDQKSSVVRQAMEIAVSALGGSTLINSSNERAGDDFEWRLKQTIEMLLSGRQSEVAE